MSDFSTVPANIKALDDEYVLGTYGRLPVEFVRASGAVLTDSAASAAPRSATATLPWSPR